MTCERMNAFCWKMFDIAELPSFRYPELSCAMLTRCMTLGKFGLNDLQFDHLWKSQLCFFWGIDCHTLPGSKEKAMGTSMRWMSGLAQWKRQACDPSRSGWKGWKGWGKDGIYEQSFWIFFLSGFAFVATEESQMKAVLLSIVRLWASWKSLWRCCKSHLADSYGVITKWDNCGTRRLECNWATETCHFLRILL